MLVSRLWPHPALYCVKMWPHPDKQAGPPLAGFPLLSVALCRKAALCLGSSLKGILPGQCKQLNASYKPRAGKAAWGRRRLHPTVGMQVGPGLARRQAPLGAVCRQVPLMEGRLGSGIHEEDMSASSCLAEAADLPQSLSQACEPPPRPCPRTPTYRGAERRSW